MRRKGKSDGPFPDLRSAVQALTVSMLSPSRRWPGSLGIGPAGGGSGIRGYFWSRGNPHQRRCRPARRFMLCACCSIQVHGNACWYKQRRVIAEIQVARDAEEHGKRRHQYREGDPSAVQPEAAAGQPERSHRIALNYRRVSVQALDGEAEDQGLAGLPSEIQSPAQPKCARAQISCGKQEAEDEGHGYAFGARSGKL